MPLTLQRSCFFLSRGFLPGRRSVTLDFSYDTLGRKVTQTLTRRSSATDSTPLALTTTYIYDELDRVVQTINPRGDIAEIIYDGNGKVEVEKIHTKLSTSGYDIQTVAQYYYDNADRRVRALDVFGQETRLSYDTMGNVIAIIDANGHTTQYEYDAMNHRTAVSDANGHRTTTAYNLAGQATSVTDPKNTQ
jgi:YD repeat-containing protein